MLRFSLVLPCRRGRRRSGRNGGVDRIELTAALRLGNAAKVSRLIAEHEDYEINVGSPNTSVAAHRGSEGKLRQG